MVATVIQRVGAWGLIVLGVLFGLFAAGYAFADPGGWRAVAIVAAFVVPTVALALVAWRLPQRAGVTVVPVVAVVALAWVALPLFPEAVRAWFDEVGPVFAMATTAVAVVLAVLGLSRPGLAGTLLLAVAVFVFVQLVIEADALVEGPGPLGLLSTSGGAILPPMAIAGVLLVIAHELQRHVGHPAARTRGRPAHA